MKILLNSKKIKTIVYINSDHGRHAILNEFNPKEIWKKQLKKLGPNEIKNNESINKRLLAQLNEIDKEEEFIQKVNTKKFIKRLLQTNYEAHKLVDYLFYGEIMTMVLLIDLNTFSYDLIQVIQGAHRPFILQNLKSWNNSPFWEEGIEFLNVLLDYLKDLDEKGLCYGNLKSDDQDIIDPRLN